jgi:glycosyltransferase involved in cell wall biosynthesis
MIIGCKTLNERNNVDLIIGDIHDQPWVDRIIVIDGGSTDGTVQKLREWKKVEVYVHPWIDTYHDQETAQSNILMSYVPYGEIYCILDFDERFSPELKQFLNQVDQVGMPTDENKNELDTIHFSRKSFELLRYEDSPYAIKGEDGWWLTSHMIGGYPDYQLRLIKRKVGMHWINSPHHILYGLGHLYSTGQVKLDILHFHGKEDARQRDHIEQKWAMNQIQRKKLGLIADIFEARLEPHLYEYLRKKEQEMEQ